MKTIFTLFLSILMAAASFAQYGQTVTISFSGNGGNGRVNNGNGNGNNSRPQEVFIDGRSYSTNNYNNNRNDRNGSWNDNSNTITLGNLQIGQHSIVINRGRNNGNRYGSVNQGDQYSPTFLVKQGYDLEIEVKGNGKVAYIERPVNNRRSDAGYGNRGRDRDYDNRNDRDDDWRNNGGYNNRGNNNGGYSRRNDGGYNNRYAPMSDATFNELLQNIRSKWLQSGKITAVKSVFDNTANYFSTYQASQLLELITNEANRFELAKLSYRNIVDKNNFTQLYNLFPNQAYRNELDRYIRSYR